MKFKSLGLYVLFITFCNHCSSVDGITGSNVRAVLQNEFPNVVCIAEYGANTDTRARTICTGTIVTSTFVLTSERCFANAQDRQIEIIMSSQNLNRSPCFYPVWWASYNQWATAKRIRVTSPHSDVLLAKIVGPFPNFVPIPISTIEPISQLYQLSGEIVGCGMTNSGELPRVQHTTTVTFISLEACMESWAAITGQAIQLDPIFICTIGNPYRYLEYGDLGGPLLYFGTIIGINMGTEPNTNGTFNLGKVNVSLNLRTFSNFFMELLTEQ